MRRRTSVASRCSALSRDRVRASRHAQAPPRAAAGQRCRPHRSQQLPPVTEARLKKPEDGDWLMVRRTYDGWGYSPLEQITPANVARLQPVWVVRRPA